jgi:chromosome segregation ATPase
MNGTPLTDVELLRRKIRRTKIGLLSATLVVIVLPGAVSVYMLHKKTWLSRADQQTIAAVVAPRVKDEVTTSFRTEFGSSLNRETAKQDAKLSELDKRVRSAEAALGSGSTAAANARTVQRLSNEVGRTIEASSVLQVQTAQIAKQVQQIREYDENAARAAQQQSKSMAQSVTQTNQSIVIIQEDMAGLRSDLKRLEDKQNRQEQELKKLDDRLKDVESGLKDVKSRLQAHEGWLRRMWNKMNGKGETP